MTHAHVLNKWTWSSVKGAERMETPLRSSMIEIVAAEERPDPCATSHHWHDAGAPSVLHRPENNSWLWWLLSVRAAKIQGAFCACDFGSHCWRRLGCFCNSSACAFGNLSIVTVVMVRACFEFLTALTFRALRGNRIVSNTI